MERTHTRLKWLALFAVMAVLFIAFPDNSAYGAELSPSERANMEREAKRLMDIGDYDKAQVFYSNLIMGTKTHQSNLLTDYYFLYGYCILYSKQNRDLRSAREKFKEAYRLDRNFSEAVFYEALATFRIYEEHKVAEDLEDSKRKMLDSQRLGFDVIEKLEIMTKRAKRNPQGQIEKDPTTGVTVYEPVPEEAELYKLLDDPRFVLQLITEEKFEFDPYDIVDPFTCPLERAVVASTDKVDIVRPGTLPTEDQQRLLMRALEIRDIVREQIGTLGQEKSLELWKELEEIFSKYLDNKFSSMERREMEELYNLFTQGELMPWYRELQRITVREEGRKVINDMNRIRLLMSEINFEKLHQEILENYSKISSYVKNLNTRYVDADGKPLFKSESDVLMAHADRILNEAHAVKEFYLLPIEIKGVVFPDLGRPLALINSDGVQEGQSLDDYTMLQLLKLESWIGVPRREILINEITASKRLRCTYKYGNVQVEVSKVFREKSGESKPEVKKQ